MLKDLTVSFLKTTKNGDYRRRKVTIIGDTSKFHLGSQTNYNAFLNMLQKDYEVVQQIPYDEFGLQLIPYRRFFRNLKKSKWLVGLISSDIFIIHGEGLTEKSENFSYHYLYFTRIAKEMGKESWVVNFSMFEGEGFAEFLNEASYLACRDILTKKHLNNLGIYPRLSFDCCVLEHVVRSYREHDGSVAAVKGKNIVKPELLKKFKNINKYNSSWKWEYEDSTSLPDAESYITEISKSKFVLTSSFHGGIFAYLSGIPFIFTDTSNPKYKALEIELLSPWKKLIPEEINENLRGLINQHFIDIYPSLIRRAKLNLRARENEEE
jgi:hypothetical protein